MREEVPKHTALHTFFIDTFGNLPDTGNEGPRGRGPNRFPWMRLVSYSDGEGARAGVLVGDGVIDAVAALGESGPITVRELLAADRLGELADAIERRGAEPEARDLLPPITDPEKIVCIGLNYRSHAAEAGIDPPSSPTIFGKYRNALAAPGATVPLPEASEKVDYEAEVAVVIGRPCSAVSEGDALDAVAGYTLLNDLSARDLQFATPQWMPGKVFDGSAPCGPALVTPDEAGAQIRSRSPSTSTASGCRRRAPTT